MDPVAFALGLDPILTRGQQLVDRYVMWRDNREQAPHLSDDFTSFEGDLTAWITRLKEETASLPQLSRDIIENDIGSLTDYITSARKLVQSVSRRLKRDRVLQFFRANAVSRECDTLSTQLGEARKLLREVNRHVDMRLAQERTRKQDPSNRFRRYFPPPGDTSTMQAVLDFDSRDGADNAITPEGQVKQHLLDKRWAGPRMVSIHGIGGVGKSTVVHALTKDEEIRGCYNDGIHVLKLGQDATKATLFGQICQVLKTSGAERTEQMLRVRSDIHEALQEFESWFDEMKCAIFVDDAWVHGIGTGILSRLCTIGSTKYGSSVVITTREHEVATLAPRRRVVQMKAREKRGRESREILFLHAECQETFSDGDYDEDATNGITGILDVCDGLPVSLAAAGKSVKKVMLDMPGRESLAWKRYLLQLEICRENLLRTDVKSYGNLYATFATSISFLDAKPREETLGFRTKLTFKEMHRRLCVMQKQALVPCTMLKHLWGVESEVHAEMIARAFMEIGLGNGEAVHVGSEYVWHLSLHDSVHDFAVAEAKRHEEEKEAHESLLVDYMSCDPDICSKYDGNAEWWCDQLVSDRLISDRYIHRNVCRHLLGAGRRRELVYLLLRPEWVEQQLKLNDVFVLKSDFIHGMEAIEEGMSDSSTEEQCEAREVLELISEAIMLSSSYVSANARELWFQVYGRLVRLGEESRGIRKYLEKVLEKAERPLLQSLNCILGEAGGMNTRIIPLDNWVECMEVMEDKKRVVCSGTDGRIVVLNVLRGEIVKEWKAHEDLVWDIAIGKNGTLLVSASWDKTVKVWDVDTHECVATFDGHSDGVNCVVVMPDGNRVVSGSDDGTARVWDIDTGGIMSKPFRGHERSVLCVAVFSDGEHFVTGGGDNRLRLWNVKDGEQVGKPFTGHESFVTCVAVTPDERRIVSGSGDETVKIWDVTTHEEIGESLVGHMDCVKCVAMNRAGIRLLSCSTDKTIRLWDIEKGKEICDPLRGHRTSVRSISFLGDDDSIVSCSRDGIIKVWDLRRKNAYEVTDRHEDIVTCISFTPDEKFVISGSFDSTVRVWEMKSGNQVGDPLRGHDGILEHIAITPDGKKIVSISDDRKICVWDLHSRELLNTLTGHTEEIYCVVVTPDGERIVTGSWDKTVRVWDLKAQDGGHVVLEGHDCAVVKVRVSDDGKRVISVDQEDEVLVWDLESSQCVKKLTKKDVEKLSNEEHLEMFGTTEIHDEVGPRLLIDEDKILYVEEEDKDILATLESPVQICALSPDKKMLCVGLYDGQVGIMKVEV